MKNASPIFIVFAGFFSICVCAQPSKELLPNALNENKELLADNADFTTADIKSYAVEERINMNFGGRITTYEVSSLSLVSTNDLGPNNVRVVKPKVARSYERILEKGYLSVDMMHIVANRLFFDGDLAKAAKWYEKLFELSNNLESVYYYRFAQCLKAIGQNEKANEMMTIFENSGISK